MLLYLMILKKFPALQSSFTSGQQNQQNLEPGDVPVHLMDLLTFSETWTHRSSQTQDAANAHAIKAELRVWHMVKAGLAAF